MSHDWARLAEAIRSGRRALGWTQQELAERADIGFSTVQRLESGRPFSRRPPSLDRIERALGWTHDSVDAVLAGGDPVVAELTPLEKAVEGGIRRSRLPTRIQHELDEGDVVDTEVLQLSHGGMRMIVVVTRDPSAEQEDASQMAQELKEWTRVQARLRGIVADEKPLKP